MKINKHGRKIRNLKAVSGATIDNPNGYSQISYDTVTGELMENWHIGNPQTSWTQYHDPDIITVARTSRHMTMQELADAVHQTLQSKAAMAAARGF